VAGPAACLLARGASAARTATAAAQTFRQSRQRNVLVHGYWSGASVLCGIFSFKKYADRINTKYAAEICGNH